MLVGIASECSLVVQSVPISGRLRGKIYRNICTGSFKTRKRPINLHLVRKHCLLYKPYLSIVSVSCICTDLCFHAAVAFESYHANDLTS